MPLYVPGAVFIVVTLIVYFVHRMKWEAYRTAWAKSCKTTAAASVALVFTVPMVQVFINSGGGAAGYDRMPIALADGVAALAGSSWPMFAPFIGGMGAFVAGSNTVSNMMFSLFQFGMGGRIGVDPTWMVALQAVGGAAGNMICVHNVVAASAVAGLIGKEGVVLRKTSIAFFYYALLTGAVGYAVVWNTQKGLFNAGSLIAAGIAALAIYLIATKLPEPQVCCARVANLRIHRELVPGRRGLRRGDSQRGTETIRSPDIEKAWSAWRTCPILGME